jgi:DNA-binding NarL/FixJ family response regulator
VTVSSNGDLRGDRFQLGSSNAAIAEELVLSAAAVKTHVNRVFWKLGLRTPAQAVVLPYESGLVTPGESR